MFGLLYSSLHYPEAKEWRHRQIYQLLTDRFASPDSKNCTNLQAYCGGTYQALVAHMDYIKNLGYNAIWISPSVAQAEGNNYSYHGYWAADYYSSNPNFGTEDDLKNMIKEAHKRDIWVMADVVYNHVGNCGNPFNPDPLDYSCIKQFNKQEYFHSPNCQIDYNTQQSVWDCRIAGLPDLNQSVPFVKDTLLAWA